MSIINNLFPPLVETYQASFIGDKSNLTSAEECVIKFKLAPYTSWNEIKSFWFTVVDPKTNRTKLNSKLWPAEVAAIDSTNIDFNNETKVGTITIQRNWISPNYWEAGNTYKIQLRLCALPISKNANPMEIGTEVNPDSALSITANSAYFSEWSTVTLVTPIQNYNIYPTGFMKQEGDNYILSPYSNTFIAGISYGKEEYLDSFQLEIYQQDTLLHSSGFVAPEDLNSIKYSIPIGLSSNSNYLFKLTTISNNLYKRTEHYPVKIKEENGPSLGLTLTTDIVDDPEYGRIKITLKTIGGAVHKNKRMLIKRTSNESNFTLWEDLLIKEISLNSKNPQMAIYDYTADSGVVYQYVFIEVDQNGVFKSQGLQTKKVLMLLEDIFINGGGRQLKIKFNPSISSYQHTVMENAIQTIGGKYPIIKRNGKMNYRQIGISGLITYHMDSAYGYENIVSSINKNNNKFEWGDPNENLFISKEKLLEHGLPEYENFNNNSRVSAHNDFILERKFREEVVKFLLDGEVKLFRSPTESPALIRLMNVSLSPNPQLGRMIYTFSATGHEIADYTPENLVYYNVQGPQAYKEIKTYEETSSRNTSYTITLPYDERANEFKGRFNLLTGLADSTGYEVKSANNIELTIVQNSEIYQGYAINPNNFQMIYDVSNSTEPMVTNSILIYYKFKEENQVRKQIIPMSSVGTSGTIKIINSDFPYNTEYDYLAIGFPAQGVGKPADTAAERIAVTVKANTTLVKYID